MLRAVLFDAGGTLITTAESVGETYAREARARGVEIPAWRLEDAFRRVLRRAPAMAFPGEAPERVRELERRWWQERVRETVRAADSAVRAGAFAGGFDAFFDALFRHFARAEAWRARPGAEEALRALRVGGLATAVVSNFDQRLPAILEGLGLLCWLDAVVLPADAGAAKPDPRIFAAALERLGVAAGEALYVGDDVADGRSGAAAAGVEAIDVAGLATLADLPARLFPGAPAREEPPA